MLRVYSEYYIREYSARAFSLSSFCCIMMFVVAVFLPFLLMISTNQFWLFTSIAYEQPKISYSGELYMNVLASDSRSYCSVARIHAPFVDQGLALNPVVSVTTEDTNNDGVPDLITLNATIPTTTSNVRQVNLIVGLDYLLQETASISMNGGIFLSFFSPAGASYMRATGDVVLVQRFPLYPSMAKRYLYLTQDLFSTFEASGYQAAFKAYHLRNDTLILEHTTKMVGISGSASMLTLEVKLRIPTNQEVMYQQPLFEILKFAWIQYMAFFVPIFAVAYYFLMWHGFRKGFLEASAHDDVVMGKVEKLKQY